jgi:archaetidylinositol phosphate synthase
VSVVDRDIRMVVLGVGEIREAVDERNRSPEVPELELAGQRTVDLRPFVGHAGEYGARTIWKPVPACLEKPAAEETASLLARSRKQRPATEVLCEHVFRPAAQLLVVVLLPLRIPPPAVVLAGTTVGLTAAAEIARGHLMLAAGLLQVKTILDNADGQLARASGRESAAGRYLDSLSDLLVNAVVFAAIAHLTGRPWLALAGFLALTLVLGADYNLDRLYRAAHGMAFEPTPAATGLGGVLARAYGVVYGPQDRLIERFVGRREGPSEQTRRAYHDRATLTVLANMGLSTQLAALGILLAVGRPTAYCWVTLACAGALVPLLLRRERLARG